MARKRRKPTTQLSLFKQGLEKARRGHLKKRYKKTILRKRLTMDVADYLEKLNDDPNVAPGSRVDDYWKKNTIALIAHNYFNPGKVKKYMPSVKDSETTVKRFGLRGLQYGNWLSQEDRYNYLFALTISMYDMKDLLNLPFQKIGFNKKLTLALGARGAGGALAHFEPYRFAINLTRYPDKITTYSGEVIKFLKKDGSKYKALLTRGGIGAFSHEWAHALDFYLGRTEYISGGRSTRYKPNKSMLNQKSAAGTMERILFKINCNPDGSKSKFRSHLEKTLKQNSFAGDYFVRRNEIFARVFEAYCAMELKRKGEQNTFIAQSKYLNWAYPSPNLIRKVAPDIKELLRYYRRS
jgi:hypothetical protein